MTLSDLVTLNADELKLTTLIASLKGGQVVQKNDTIYFQHPSQVELHAYPHKYLDFIMEWGELDLKLTDVQKNIVFEGSRKKPVHCTFKNGETSDYCFVLLTHLPPPLSFFADGYKPPWYFLSQVREMLPSPRVVGAEVWSTMTAMEKRKRAMLSKILKIKGNLVNNREYDELIKNKPNPVVVRGGKGEMFKFQSIQQVVYHEDVNPLVFSLVEDPTAQQINSARELSIPEDPNADRKPARPLSEHVYIIADSESSSGDRFLFNEV